MEAHGHDSHGTTSAGHGDEKQPKKTILISGVIALIAIFIILCFVLIKSSGGTGSGRCQHIQAYQEISFYQDKTYSLPAHSSIQFEFRLPEYYVFNSDDYLVCYDDAEAVEFPWYKDHFDGNAHPHADTKFMRYENHSSKDMNIRCGRVPSFEERYKINF